MKTTPQQNKILAPILVLVLIGLFTRIVAILRGDDPPAPAVTPVQAVAEAPSSARSLAELHETSARDPFSHPSLAKGDRAPAPSGDPPGQPHGVAVEPANPLSPMPGFGTIEPAPVDMMTTAGQPAIQRSRYNTPAPLQSPGSDVSRPVAGAQAGALVTPLHNANPSNGLTTSQAELIDRLKLKAILGGDRPSAVIEGYGSQPLIVHQGDAVGPLEVGAIHAAEIVLSGTEGIWTLPLETSGAASEALNPSDVHKEDSASANH